jgi:signal transduction histidine kinase
MEKQIRSRGIDIELSCESGLYISGNRTQLESVLHNLLSNSRDAFEGRLKGGRRIGIKACREGSGFIYVEFRDNAGGIPSHVLERIFEPFFTTKGEGSGTGLGLAISRKIVMEHGGTMECRTEGESTLFGIRLPKLDSELGNAILAA